MNMLQKGLLALGDDAERTGEKKNSHKMAFVLVGTMLLGRTGKEAKDRVGQIAHDVGC